ncbi:WbqC family protein [Fibrella sp. HMF5405]|uniref:WbqC family protein n=2 Tax=Fibrella forsythiae TaxID=2817061 RepID=A0ABS3JRU1_9BACT|nr:WbqC family protein [Fibrella forsythiae]
MRGMALADEVLIEAHENYQKQSYRNRCYVLTSNKVDCLTVPVLNSTRRQPVRDVQIDYSQNWIDRHLRCLQSAYAKSPYFEYLMPEIEVILNQHPPFLFDLNWSVLTLCRKWLRLSNPIRLTEWYEKTPGTGVFDARSRIEPGQYAEIGLFGPIPGYQQNFGAEFVSNLSVIDLLFAGEDMRTLGRTNPN